MVMAKQARHAMGPGVWAVSLARGAMAILRVNPFIDTGVQIIPHFCARPARCAAARTKEMAAFPLMRLQQVASALLAGA